jgi:hypothetical protein
MVGYLECFYTYEFNNIEFVKVEFMQEYRKFEYYDNWDASVHEGGICESHYSENLYPDLYSHTPSDDVYLDA